MMTATHIPLSDCRSLAGEFEMGWRDIVTAVADDETDFEVCGYRFIAASMIDEVMQNELASDTYMLGCFNSWFLADVLDIDCDVIAAMQKAEAFDAIGKLVLSMGKVGELQELYVRHDGYGHHFNHWDGSEETIHVGGVEYYSFRQ
ncbi:MAG: hypothetical protein ACR2PR_08830 [Pseudohongiellaceae bacterium]